MGKIKENKIARLVEKLLWLIEDANRQGLIDTPRRVARMYEEIYSGYSVDIEALFKAKFEEENDSIVVIKDIPFYSQCEHHMVPFMGKVHIAYLPDQHVLGLSKFARVVDAFAHRLQIQEKMTRQILEAVVDNLAPKGCMVIIEAEHLCMAMRGIKKHDTKTVTSAISGLFATVPTAKEEAIKLIYP